MAGRCDMVILTVWKSENVRRKTLTIWVLGCLDDVQQLHVADVVNVYLDLKDDHQRLPVEFDGED